MSADETSSDKKGNPVKQPNMLSVGVLGAGVVGLTSALEVLSTFPSAHVTIMADKFNEETTSDGAAGIFRPGTSFSGPTLDITKRWICDSYDYYKELLSAPNCGVSEVSGYIFSSLKPSLVRNHLLEDILPVYRAATADELQLCPGNFKYGSFYTTVITECPTFLPWCLNRIAERGGKVMKKSVQSFDELQNQFDVVFNCTGLGAKELCNDYKLVPIRGQVAKVDAPWLKQFFYADYDTYIVPNSRGIVTLGGCRHYDSHHTDICPHDQAAILERCYKLVPRLKNDRIIKTWVGLRPHRDPVRVEVEQYGKLKIIHNYGHGGYGITAAPGTAKHAVQLLKQSLSSRSKL